jgi:hypothetical protein
MPQDVRGQRLFVIITLVLLFLGSAGIGVFMLVWNPKPTGQLMEVEGISPRITRTVAINAPAGWREKFDAVYKLADGEIVKRIPPPWIPEREYYWKTEYGSVGGMNEGPTFIQLQVSNGSLQNAGMGFGGGTKRSIRSVVESIGAVRAYQLEIPDAASDVDMGGDYIVREPSTTSQKLDALAKIMNGIAGTKYRFAEQKRQREVVVATGSYSFKPKADAPDQTAVHIYADAYDRNGRDGGGGTTDVASLISFVSQLCDVPILVETDLSQGGMAKFRIHQSAYSGESAGRLDKMLANLADQTGLKFEKVKREVPVWALVAE